MKCIGNMDVVQTVIILLSLSCVGASSSSIGSEFESSLSCSKFHFEEKVLEKLVRLEHKMQILEEKMDVREKLNTAKLDEINNIMNGREKLNTAKLVEISNIKKQIETFVQSTKDDQIREQTRFNKSYQETVKHFKTQADNETDKYGDQMNALLESLSSKIGVFTEAEKKRESVIELTQRNLDREQKRFNSSYEQIVENFHVNSNKKLQELIVNQQKEFKKMIQKRETVAFSAYRSSSQTLSNHAILVFNGVLTNVGNGYEPSSGVFAAPHPGLYHMTAVVMSTYGNSLGLYLCHNGNKKIRSFISGDGYKTGTFDVLFNLQKGDKVHIESDTSQTIFGSRNRYLTFSGYRIS